MSAPRIPRAPQSGSTGSNPVAASADGKTRSTLGINMVRLPIGHSAEDPRPQGPRTMFWLVIPTNTGGRLTCTHEGGGILTLLAHDGRTKIGGNGTSILDIAIHPKSHGLMYVAADEGTPRKVKARFTQEGVAREGTGDKDKPLIPWNFWYFPIAHNYLDGKRNSGAGEPEAIIRKFVLAVKKDPTEAAELVAKATKWEREHHSVDVGPEWEGHCHNSAGASIVFEQPVAKTVNGQSFSEDDLELIAAELFGNLSDPGYAFVLRGTALGVRPLQMFSGRSPGGLPFETDDDKKKREAPPVIGNSSAEFYYPMCFKPSEAKRPTEAMLAKALTSLDPSLEKRAAHLAHAAFTTLNMPKILRDWFGELAAQFYFALVECILKGKHALEGDLASSDPSSGPEEVWNHAVFHYGGEFVETVGTDDPQDITLTVDLTANADFRDSNNSSPGAPAEVTRAGGVNLHGAFEQRRSQQILRIIFDDAGEVTFDARNDWLSARNADVLKNSRDPNANAEVYAPRYLAWMELDFSERALILPHDPNPKSRGNVGVQLDAITGGVPLLTLRKRFRP